MVTSTTGRWTAACAGGRGSWPTTRRTETDPDHTSEVEVRFFAEGPARTRLELEHRHLERHGPSWHAVREGVDGDEGWPLYLSRFAALLPVGS